MFTKLNLICNDHLAGTHTCTKLIYCVTCWEVIVFNNIKQASWIAVFSDTKALNEI
jgi:hypothetical protein